MRERSRYPTAVRYLPARRSTPGRDSRQPTPTSGSALARLTRQPRRRLRDSTKSTKNTMNATTSLRDCADADLVNLRALRACRKPSWFLLGAQAVVVPATPPAESPWQRG